MKLLGTKKAKEYMADAIKEVVRFIRAELYDAAPVRTGKLRKAIDSGNYKVTAGEARGYVWIRRKGGYQAHLIEFGHRKVVRVKTTSGYKKVLKGFQPAQPFFRPVIDNNESLILAVFRSRLSKLISEAGA